MWTLYKNAEGQIVDQKSDNCTTMYQVRTDNADLRLLKRIIVGKACLLLIKEEITNLIGRLNPVLANLSDCHRDYFLYVWFAVDDVELPITSTEGGNVIAFDVGHIPHDASASLPEIARATDHYGVMVRSWNDTVSFPYNVTVTNLSKDS